MSDPWTDVPPSAPGYYWCTTPSWDDGNPRLVLFVANGYTGKLRSDTGSHGPDDVMFRRSLWVGPLDLTPPAKPH